MTATHQNRIEVNVTGQVSAAEIARAPGTGGVARVKGSPARLRIFDGTVGKHSLALLDQALVSGTRFLTVIIVGRVCGPKELGLYVLAFSPMILIGCAQEALLSQPYTVYGNRRQGLRRAALAGSVLMHYVVLSLVAMIGLSVVAGILFSGVGTPQSASILLILAIVIPSSLLWELARRFGYAHLKLASVVAIDMTVSVVQIGGIVVLAWIGWLSAMTAFLVIGLACGLAGLGWLVLSRKHFIIRRKNVLRDWKSNWSLGRWLAASQMVGALHGQVMPWILAISVGTLATGVFAACESIVSLSNLIVLGFANLLGPETALAFARGGKLQVRRVTGRALMIILGSICLLCVFLIVFADHLIGLVYGSQFQGATGVLSVLAICTLAWAAGITIGKGLLAIERPDVNFRARIFGLAVTLVLALPLVLYWQTIGAAWALFGGSFASVTCQGFAFVWLTGNLREGTAFDLSNRSNPPSHELPIDGKGIDTHETAERLS